MLRGLVSERAQRFLDVVDSLCAEEVGGKLIALGSGGAFVAMPDGTAAAIIASTRGPIEELEAHLRGLIEGNRGVSLKLVVVGGDASYRALLERVKPKLMVGRNIQVFALGDDRQAWAGSGARLDSPTGRVLVECGARDVPREVDAEALKATIVAPKPEEIAAYHERRGFAEKLSTGRPTATMAIITGYALCFALAEVWGGGDLHPTLTRMGGLTAEAFTGEPWRVLSASWLHLGWMHLLVNGYVMYVLGGFVERLIGWPRMVLVYVASALGGGLASALLSDAPLSVGASGAIWGLLGTAVALAFRPAGVIPASMVPALRRTALINAGINLAVSFLPQVDIMAHLGGGIVGLALGLTGLTTRGLVSETNDGDRKLRPWAIGAIAVHVAALVTAIVVGRPWALLRLDDVRTHAFAGVDITVPAELGEPVALPSATGSRFAVGSIGRDALAMEVDIARFEGAAMSAAEVAVGFAELQATEREHPEWLTPLGARRVLDDAKHPTMEERFTAAGGGLRLVVWTQIRPEGHVYFEGLSWAQHTEVEARLRAAFDSIELRE